MSAPAFTVLLPVTRPPALLPYAVQSVQAQSCADFELFVICDGAPDETVQAAQALASADRRIRVFAHPKGERHGEAHRHVALQQASGRYVCQIGDDDLWFDNHLAEAQKLMETADFGNLLGVQLGPDGVARMPYVDLRHPSVRGTMLRTRLNFFGPTCCAYRLETYRALPVGWSPAPPDVYTDLWMWRKFLALPGIRCATWPVMTSLALPAPPRAQLDLATRREETRHYAGLIGRPRFRETLWRAALLDVADQLIRAQQSAQAQAAKVQAADAEAGRLAAALGEVLAATGDTGLQTRLAREALAAREAASSNEG